MGEPDRDQKLAPVLGRELDRDMLAESRRRAANVDRDVEDAPRAQRTSLSCANGGVWKCKPRKTPFAAE